MRFLALLSLLCLFAAPTQLRAADLINGLSDPPTSGFGENSVVRGDDNWAPDDAIGLDITSIFPSGLMFGGQLRTHIFVNTNGNITFLGGDGTFTPSNITASASEPRIAPFFADVDTRPVTTTATPGGNSKGTNLVYWDLDTANGVITVTWDDVGYFSLNTDRKNAFQMRITKIGTDGEFDLEFRYEVIQWVVGNVSGSNIARAGFTAGNGTDAFELDASGDASAMINLSKTSNLIPAQPGIYRFHIRRPVATITPATNTRVSTDPILFTVTWDSNVHGLTLSDISTTGGTAVSLVQISANAYQVGVHPSGDGNVSMTINAGAVFAEKTGNTNIAVSHTLISDRTKPTITLTPNGTTVHTTSVVFTATGSEDLSNLTASDVVTDNGSVRSVVRAGTDTFLITVDSARDGSMTVYIPALNATDLAGNPLSAVPTATVTIDSTGPGTTVTRTSGSPTNTGPMTFSILFDSAVSGFTIGDVVVTNGTATSLTGSGAGPYTLSVTPTSSGTVIVNIPAGVATDVDGLDNLPGGASGIYDTTAPTVSISMPPGPLGSSGGTATLTFSEPVNFTGANVSATGATVGAPTLVGGTTATYTVALTSPSAASVVLSVLTSTTDLAGNALGAVASSSVAADATLAGLTITTSATTPTGTSPIPVTFTFSAGAVVGFDANDVTVTNGVRGTLSGAGPYTMNVVPSGSGPVRISVASGACTVGGIANGAAQLTAYYDALPPTATFRVDPSNAVPGQIVVVTITFSEPITGFTLGDVAVTNGSAISLTGSGTTYQLTVTCDPRPSLYTRVNLPAGVLADLAGTSNATLTVTVAGSPAKGSSTSSGGSECAQGAGMALLLPFCFCLLPRLRRRR
jgi:hypothetical protein